MISLDGLQRLHTYLSRPMEGGLASSWHNFHLSTAQLLPADLKVGLCAPFANSIDGLVLCSMNVCQRALAFACAAKRIYTYSNTRIRNEYSPACTRRRVSASP